MSKERFFLLLIRSYVAAIFGGIKNKKGSCSVKNDEVLRILVIPQTSRIGDLVCATPVFRAIKEKYPDSFLGVLVSRKKKSWEIVKHNPHINELFFYEDSDLITELTNRKFHWSLNLTNYPVPSVITFLARIPCRVKTVIRGRSKSEMATDWLNTHRILYKHHTYLPRHYLSLLELIDIHNPPEVKEVFKDSNSDTAVQIFFREHDLYNRFLVGVSVTAGNKIKEWPLKRFAELINRLLGTYDATIVLVGASHEYSFLKAFSNMTQKKDRVVIANSFSVESLPSLLGKFKVMVGVDMGLIYVANALRVPVLDITGPCDPREQPPLDNRSELVLPPSPDYYSSFVMKRPGTIRERRAAVESISVDQVFKSLITFLARIKQLPPKL